MIAVVSQRIVAPPVELEGQVCTNEVHHFVSTLVGVSLADIQNLSISRG